MMHFKVLENNSKPNLKSVERKKYKNKINDQKKETD